MAEVNIYNQQGKQTDTLDLEGDIFSVDIEEAVVHEVFTTLRANQREAWAHSKNRSEKSGGGSKPWQQKGTGRARHGSIRSPLWTNGGVTFGPRNEKNQKKDINQNKKRLAVKMCLTDKIKGGLMYVVEEIDSSGKTKEMAELKNNLLDEQRPTLFLLEENDPDIRRASRNLPDVDLQLAKDANVVDFLNNKYVVTTKKGMDKLKQRFL